MCVVGAQPESIALLPRQPGGETDDAHGVPPVPHVRDVVGGGSEVPQVQEHGFARDFLIIKTVTTKTTDRVHRSSLIYATNRILASMQLSPSSPFRFFHFV